ncbi:MAG TPA: DNA polymerase IV [Parasegetibacter sp.]
MKDPQKLSEHRTERSPSAAKALFPPGTKAIAHLDMDAFFVSVEIKKNPRLAGIPLIVGGQDRGVVAACSYEARKFGIHSAMPAKQAKSLCPHATFIKGSYADYTHFSRQVTQIIAASVPLYQKASIDEFYIDLTGLEKFFGTEKYLEDLVQTIKQETGLPLTYALSTSKLVSKIAANEVKPNGQIIVAPGTEKDYLAPLSIDKIPGIGKKTASLMRAYGIHLIRDLAALTVEDAEARFGNWGKDIWLKANGIDHSPVHSQWSQKSISTENTFHENVLHEPFLQKELIRMTEKVAFELRAQNKVTGCVAVKIRYSDFSTFTKQASIPYTSANHILLKAIKEVFRQLYESGRPVRLMGVRLTDLTVDQYQTSLFDNREDTMKLYKAVDSLKKRYGTSLVQLGGGI